MSGLMTWLTSDDGVREVMRVARKKHAFIVTKHYLYTISNIRAVGSLYYCLEFTDRVRLNVKIDPKTYEELYRPKANMYIKREDFTNLIVFHAKWNRVDQRVILYYDESN